MLSRSRKRQVPAESVPSQPSDSSGGDVTGTGASVDLGLSGDTRRAQRPHRRRTHLPQVGALVQDAGQRVARAVRDDADARGTRVQVDVRVGAHGQTSVSAGPGRRITRRST
ncbi:hypothetical protein CAE01nite_34330 [Cellulomonas aerilata]|uniref:Uncharacterized protein n=1 Tax=Cellulomonas aerilata TaxID=515326 RepID=A0A512DGV1_9CELL|nr:hypothetical protein CAE01nite_34330 [Cellulomonas aerilata]